MDSHRSFIIHAHFYQPPREDPVTNKVPVEPSAYPYHDWNEKIYETCYLPNIQIGNFSRISYDIGPTLCRWLRIQHPDALELIVNADRQALLETGHGNAIAQPYHHTILPLATKQEKETEIIWGIEDFQHVFGRKPEGMWLPETAVDAETLSILADLEIKFTILAPWQLIPDSDSRQCPYRVSLPGGKEIAVFIYNGELSARASFDSFATSNADQFAEEHIRNQFANGLNNQYVMMATDGELYGHHQVFRDLFLSQLVNGSLKTAGLQLEFPAAWLGKNSKLPFAKIIEKTSWSCHHGINRWQEECGCTPEAKWKQPLREFLTKVASGIDDQCEQFMGNYRIDLRSARNAYIHVLLGDIPFDDWISTQTTTVLNQSERNTVAKLFHAQEYRLRMFTSCGWFFDDFDRIEPRNSVTCAAYGIYMIKQALGVNLEADNKTSLSRIKSEVSGITGDTVFYEAYKGFL